MIVPPDREIFRWGFSTLGCAELSLPQICGLLGEFGMSELEIRAIASRTDLPQWSRETAWTSSRAAAIFAEHAVRFRVAGSSFKLVGNDEQSRAELLEFASWADSWGAKYLRAFGGGAWGTPLAENDFRSAAETISWWRRERQRCDWQIELLLETHDAFSASAPCVQLQSRLDEPLGIIWDSHHTWRLGDESPRESWSQLAPWIRHVHVKDSVGKPSTRHPYTYVLPGEGEMPLAETLAVLRENRFSGCVSLEWEKLWHPYLPSLRDALVRLKRQPWFAPPVESQTAAHAR
jgi:sugar phosphate isomerase/epimerase